MTKENDKNNSVTSKAKEQIPLPPKQPEKPKLQLSRESYEGPKQDKEKFLKSLKEESEK